MPSSEGVLASGAWLLLPTSVGISPHRPGTKKEVCPLGIQATWGMETSERGAASSLLRGGPGSASLPLPEQGFECLLLKQARSAPGKDAVHHR